jgi:pimeloyl-ACP methyl ester carboxylesterase
MNSRIHDYAGHQVHSLLFGTGEHLLFAFHGYGDRARLFAPLESVLSPHFKVIAIDLPFHGQTLWQNNTFNKADIMGILSMYMTEQQATRCSFLGYSFGARIVQAILPEVISFTDRLILLAPDGIATKGLRAAIYTPMWVRKLSFYLIRNPRWFLTCMAALRKIGLLNPVIWLFMEKNLATPERYRRTFGMWFALDYFWLRRSEVNRLINTTGVRVDIFYGKKDTFVQHQKVKKRARALVNARLFLLNSGHRIIGPELSIRLSEALNLGADEQTKQEIS